MVAAAMIDSPISDRDARGAKDERSPFINDGPSDELCWIVRNPRGAKDDARWRKRLKMVSWGFVALGLAEVALGIWAGWR